MVEALLEQELWAGQLQPEHPVVKAKTNVSVPPLLAAQGCGAAAANSPAQQRQARGWWGWWVGGGGGGGNGETGVPPAGMARLSHRLRLSHRQCCRCTPIPAA